MPTRLLLSGIAAAILLTSTVIIGTYLGRETSNRFAQIDESWRTYASEAERRGVLVSRMRGLLGYGGIIHHFKNYVLRQDEKYLHEMRIQFGDFKKTIKEYRLSNASKAELVNLHAIANTIALYESKLPIAVRAAREKWSPARTDKLVRVNDAKALQGLEGLVEYWHNKRRASTKAIATAVTEGTRLVEIGFVFLPALLVVSLILFTLFYILQKELRETVGKLSAELIERKAAQHITKKFFRAVDQSPATIIITGINGLIEYVNRKFCELSGYTPSEVIGQTPKLLQSDNTSQKIYADLKQQIALGHEWRGVFKNRTKSGDDYWVSTAILPLRDENGAITHYIGLGEDVTERRKAREQIHKAQKMEAVGLLASGVAHDFNNVLTTIIGNVHLALLDTPKGAPIREELEQIDIAAKRARNLVSQILVFARRQPGERINLSVTRAVSEVCQLMRASLQSNIELDCEIADERLFVLADPTRLHQILLNLCGNAAEAIGLEGGKVTIQAIEAKEDEYPSGFLLLTIKDTGPGISAEYQDKIFDPFFTTKPVGKGTGLGLSVVANLVSEMGGKITFTSSPQLGTCFDILLPKGETSLEALSISHRAVGGNEHILLIDDEEDVVKTYRKLLEKLGYSVDAHTDPEIAMEAFRAAPNHFDLVMTDYIMPALDGEDVAKKVRSISTDCPIIVSTTYHQNSLRRAELAPLKLMEKPVDPLVLAHTVRHIIDQTD